MYNPAGQITETTIANLAVRLDRATSTRWVTPAESCGLLPGMARKQMLSDGELVEGVVTIEELQSASEVSAVGSAGGVGLSAWG